MKKIPDFRNETEERDFLETNDTSDYIDWSKASFVVFPNLKKTTKAISLRMLEDMLAKLNLPMPLDMGRFRHFRSPLDSTG